MEWKKNSEFYNKFYNMQPGKYWKLPSHKKHLLNDYLNDNDYWGMIKYDGEWSRIIIHEEGVIIQSRSISKKTGIYGRKEEMVPHIVKELIEGYPAGTVLLAELCYPYDFEKTSSDVGSILRCKAPKAIERQKGSYGMIHARIFDVLAFNYNETYTLPFKDRFVPNTAIPGATFNDKIESNANGYEFIAATELQFTGDKTDLLDIVLNKGGEGIILLNINEPYKIGNAKAQHSVKVKKELGELEARVVDIIEPTKIYSGDQQGYWPYLAVLAPNKQIMARYYGNKEEFKSKLDEDGIQFGIGYTIEEVTKPFYNGWKSGVIIEFEGNRVNITSGTTDEDGEWLGTDAAKEKIENGELYAVFSGMSKTTDSIRHPYLIRLRDDM